MTDTATKPHTTTAAIEAGNLLRQCEVLDEALAAANGYNAGMNKLPELAKAGVAAEALIAGLGELAPSAGLESQADRIDRFCAQTR